jgi:hypothetical protein
MGTLVIVDLAAGVCPVKPNEIAPTLQRIKTKIGIVSYALLANSLVGIDLSQTPEVQAVYHPSSGYQKFRVKQSSESQFRRNHSNAYLQLLSTADNADAAIRSAGFIGHQLGVMICKTVLWTRETDAEKIADLLTQP